jgi:hypothetical protein
VSHSTGSPTKADIARFEKLHRIGCLCCRKAGSGYRAPEIHHILSGGRRISHQATLPLCEHHRIPSTGAVVGPSLADGSRVFSAKWGTQLELLAEVNALIDRFNQAIPEAVAGIHD